MCFIGMRLLIVALGFLGICRAEEWSLERLYRRPYIWGTPPQSLAWSEEGHTLAFLWNAEGGRFLDLYAYQADSRRLVRLTDLEAFEDELLASPAEKDERRRQYLEPREGIRDFRLSRNGKSIVFAYRGDLFTVPTDASSPPFRLTRTRDPETAPQFSPDGAEVAALRGGQIVTQHLGNGRLWQVTDVEESFGSITAYRWSPDGAHFAIVVRKGKIRQMPLPNYSGRFVTAEPFPRSVAGDEPPEVAVLLVPARGGRPVEVDLGDWGGKVYLSEPLWSKDSRRLALRLIHPSMKRLRILVADAASGRAVKAYEEEDPRWIYVSEFGWSPDSREIFFVSERDGWAHLYRVPASGGEPFQITRGRFECRPERFSFDDGYKPQWVGEYLYYTSTEDGTAERHIYRIRPDGSGKEKLSRQEGVYNARVSEDGKHVAWQFASIEEPADLFVDGVRITRRTRPEFARYPWPRTRFVSFPSRADGKPVAARLLLPPGYEPADRSGKKWPAVFYIHGAGYATSVLKQWGSYQELRHVFNCYLANRGYLIVDVDYRGSSGYGRDWRSEVYLHLGGLDLEDLLSAIDFLRTLGNVDIGRLGVWGVSYGGFLTNMAMFLAPDAFRAGSSWASVNDWENYSAGYTHQRLNRPRDNPEAYRRSSPITYAGRLKNHLLVVHGMVDSNVLFQDAVQLTEKLIQEGKDFGHIFYPQEDHGFVRDETWIDACRRTAAWFDRYLK
jgi:dipeptidyl aminopeptidase/acylaminoacyl peptidase